LNYALDGMHEQKTRCPFCWHRWNGRPEREWKVWQDVKIPKGSFPRDLRFITQDA